MQIDADIYMNKNNSKKKLSYLSINGPGDSVGWEQSVRLGLSTHFTPEVIKTFLKKKRKKKVLILSKSKSP